MSGGEVTQDSQAGRRRRWLLWLIGALLLLWFVGASVWATLPKGVIVIGAGPEGGTYAQHAQAYARQLARLGLQSRIEHVGDSLRIVDRVNGPCPCLDVGFTAQAVEAAKYPNVVSAGAIELQPLFLFVRKSIGAVDSLAALQGRKVLMPLEHSASSEAARAVLAQVKVQTAPPRYLPIAEAAAALQRGEADAGFFMLSPGNALISQLLADPALSLFSFEQNLGLSRRIDHLQPALLARAAFDPAADLPPRDTQLVAASVNVVVRRDIHPVVLYALLNAMNEVHRGQTLVSNHGDFPNTVRTALPVHEKAAAWAKNGTPWLYEKLPPWLASPLDEYWGMALVHRRRVLGVRHPGHGDRFRALLPGDLAAWRPGPGALAAAPAGGARGAGRRRARLLRSGRRPAGRRRCCQPRAAGADPRAGRDHRALTQPTCCSRRSRRRPVSA